ncbi:DUF4355 domain-containing protein [Limosilactobacillus fastidiosus]|uniref:DUF4355 domain-containing protein n=1 Tax=Limosilactobacillus fastidiosus TaxID=2759855 RepID=A0A7W3TZW9_9LACO|nr:DUF4355 domain-containing protein [Limosilactobacillus fastidiosus]MBB1086379.1 DUF4355 domain-containing protein [Limosilactobacillus fastidiosus]MCD7086246.1 DUF4355 domain-containing protein [Limosilactobacillus fastidiosus]MCD7115009.1 DUF4355 domain-containing protein [Limosilactobacillus fastidiosus]MCD7116828.1 DUF4355 domain-containing protein [Limosilactobacillus fastidiosus]
MENKFPMNLQFFAEQATDGSDTGAPDEPQVNESEQNNPEKQQVQSEKMFTQEEVDKMIQKRLDRAMKDKDSEIESAKNEAVKLAKMNKDQKKDYELQQAQQHAQDAEAKLARYELRDAARKQLIDAGYTPTDDDIDLIVTDKAESTQANAAALLDMVERIKESVRNDLLKGKTPSGGGLPVKKQKSLNEMSLMERVQLRNEDPKRYQDLVKDSGY